MSWAPWELVVENEEGRVAVLGNVGGWDRVKEKVDTYLRYEYESYSEVAGEDNCHAGEDETSVLLMRNNQSNGNSDQTQNLRIQQKIKNSKSNYK